MAFEEDDPTVNPNNKKEHSASKTSIAKDE